MSNFSYLDALTYTYALFSISTDGDYDSEEIKEVIKITKEWAPDASAEEIGTSIKKTLDLFLSDASEGKVQPRISAIIDALNSMFTDDNKKSFIKDLERIGKADGDYDESEKRFVELFKQDFGVA